MISHLVRNDAEQMQSDRLLWVHLQDLLIDSLCPLQIAGIVVLNRRIQSLLQLHLLSIYSRLLWFF